MVAITQYRSLTEYLNSLFENKKQKNELFSLRAWARMLGYKNPSYLVQVLKSERKVNLKLIESICRTEELSVEEERYMKLLYMRHSVDIESDELFETLFNAIKPDTVPSYDLLSRFDCFSSWYPFFIVEFTKIEGEVASRDNIVRLLSPFIEADQVDSFLDELLKAELLTFEDAVFSKSLKGEIRFEPEVANSSVKLFHHSSIKRADAALIEQDRSIRDIRSTMVALDSEGYEEACKIIREAHKKVSRLAAKKGDAISVYQFNSQLYMPVEISKDKDF